MRVLSWFGGLFIVLAIAIAAIASVAHQRADGSHALAAAKHPVALDIAAQAPDEGNRKNLQGLVKQLEEGKDIN